LIAADLLLIVALIEDSDQETVGDTRDRLVLTLPCDDSPLGVSGRLVALDEEGGGAQGVERTLTVVLDADVQLVVTYGHQSVLEVVHTITNFGEDYILKSASSHLNESDTEYIVHVVLYVSEHITHDYIVAFFYPYYRILILNTVGKGGSGRVAYVG
jgi:hypothetical protein